MNWYFKLVASHPCIIVSVIGTFSTVAFIISITNKKLPNFSDPQLGFETRGTDIANRLTAWENLYEATRPSGLLTVNPKGEFLHFKSSQPLLNLGKISFEKSTTPVAYTQKNVFTFSTSKSKEEKLKFKSHNELEYALKDHLILQENLKDSIDSDSDEEHSHDHDHDHLSSDNFFCDGLSPDFSHFVLETTNPSQSLLSMNALYSICIIQERLMNNEIIGSLCQTVSHGKCCHPWSLPNYIVLLHNLTDCKNITEESIQLTKSLLEECFRYYNNLKLSPDCYESSPCHGVPEKCAKFNAVYNILYYLTDVDFLMSNYSGSKQNGAFLNRTMIFLPVARSSAALPFYYNLSSTMLMHRDVAVSAMDMGLKNALFNDCLLRDALLMIAGGSFMIFCIWSYTNSLFITICTVFAIIMSLITSYFIYTFFFKIKFFPFMNLLAIVVAIGIGADDAFIFYKTWRCFECEKMKSSIEKLVSETLKHSSLSMFVTSLTTAAAFYSSSVSSITAIKCFSIFAGTAVLANFLLMITWLPACFVISEKTYCSSSPCQQLSAFYKWIISIQGKALRIKEIMEKCLIVAVIRFKLLWLLLFTITAMGSAVIVLYYPKLRLPDSRNFHLFQSSHLFERYDLIYREKFWFERLEKVSGWDNSNFKLPLRFVWGILPVDNGNYFEPDSKGTLEFDSSFNISSPDSQSWLLNFCRLLRSQPFYQSTQGPLLPNCFIESFKNWMARRCKDTIDNIDRTPCCESSKFPYPQEVFDFCIVEAIGSLYETPADYFLPGVAGPKFSKTERNEIKVIVVEYDSNHPYSMSFKDMHDFYSTVDTWFQEQLLSAPPGMKNGWFISQLSFYDLQLALSDGTSVAIGVSMGAALAVFFLISLNLLISIYTIVTISFTIFVTVGFLVLLGWSLNVVESIAVTTAIGLAVDFSLHYGITYGLFVDNCRESAVKFTLKRMGGPTLMAALTTGAAGFFMLPSSVLAYIQIGVFLVVVMTSSWLYSTMFLMSLLSVLGPHRGFAQFSYKSLLWFCTGRNVKSPSQSNKTVYTNVLPDASLSISSIADATLIHPNTNEIHEMEAFTRFNKGSKSKVLLEAKKVRNSFTLT